MRRLRPIAILLALLLLAACIRFDEIQAPSKRLFWLDGSAHNAPFEEPAAFDAILIGQVLPVVEQRLQP